MPVKQQERIAVWIEELTTKIEEGQRIRADSTQQTEALLLAEINKLFSEYSGENTQPLSNVIVIANGQGLKQNERDESGDYTVYGAGGPVGKHSIALSNSPFVVIGRKGSAGHTTYAPEGGWVIDTAYYSFPQDNDELGCKYLFYALKSLDFKKDIISTAIPGINRSAIYKHKIPVPSLSSQLQIVNHLDTLAMKLEGLKRLQAETAVELDALWPSVLDRAFNGEL